VNAGSATPTDLGAVARGKVAACIAIKN
jgi:hypothetical protein